jgi:AcrR family transcriptional regulator
VIVTPWGRADELRSRKLHPGPSASREAVERNQRERLLGAMVAAVAERGYDKTRVEDLLALSGVSRSTFYKRFTDKHDCFVATLDGIVAAGGERVVAAYTSADGSWEARLHAALAALVESIVVQPAAARLYYVESYAAGGAAVERIERMSEQLEQLVKRALDQSPERADMPRDLLRAVLRGFRRVIQTRLRSGRERELIGQAPELLSWALSYRTPPERLRRPRKPPRRLLPEHAEAESARERILDAVIELMADESYRELTITAIAERAAISLTTFYKQFDGKEDATLAALRSATRRVYETVAPAYSEAPDWPSGVGAAIHALFAYLTFEPPFAHFGGVTVHSGSPLVVELRDQLLTAAHSFLAEGYRQHPDTRPIAAEAIAASIDSLLFDQVRRRGGQRLYAAAPTATYIALVPFIGAERACAVANASR